MRSARGFSLLEMMTVVAILGVIGALSVSTFDSLNARSAPKTAAAQISSALTLARNRAIERGADVWFIIYPNERNRGAYWIYEDVATNFRSTTELTGGSRIWSNFSPPNNVFPKTGERSRLIESVYLDTYSRQNVEFISDAGVPWGSPFDSLNSSANLRCTFCTTGGPDNKLRGAMVFTGDGTVYFVDGDGNLVNHRAGGFTIGGRINGGQGTRFAVSSSTGYGGFFQE